MKARGNARTKQLDETARLVWASAIAFYFAYSIVAIFMGGCSVTQKETIKKNLQDFASSAKECVLEASSATFVAAESQLESNIVAAVNSGTLPDSNTWKQAGVGLITVFTGRVIACAASRLWARLLKSRVGTMLSTSSASLESQSTKSYLDTVFQQALQ